MNNSIKIIIPFPKTDLELISNKIILENSLIIIFRYFNFLFYEDLKTTVQGFLWDKLPYEFIKCLMNVHLNEQTFPEMFWDEIEKMSIEEFNDELTQRYNKLKKIFQETKNYIKPFYSCNDFLNKKIYISNMDENKVVLDIDLY